MEYPRTASLLKPAVFWWVVHLGLTYAAWYLSFYQLTDLLRFPSLDAVGSDIAVRAGVAVQSVAYVVLLALSFPFGWPLYCLSLSFPIWFFVLCGLNGVFWIVLASRY